MKIAVIGTGGVGGTLGRRLAARLGPDAVVYGSRTPSAERVLAFCEKQGPGARAMRVRDAVEAADVAVLCIPGEPCRRRGLGPPDAVLRC